MPRVVILSIPRTGSTFLQELLNNHEEIHIAGELLNSESEILCDPLVHVEKQLSAFPQNIVGFKVFPEQIIERGIHFDQLLRHIGATSVIVLWREDLLETLTSLRIAEKTDVWYSTEDSSKVEKIHIDPIDVQQFFQQRLSEWCTICEQWPSDIQVQPILIRYEDLLENPTKQLKSILARLSCISSEDLCFTTVSRRQNPAKLSEKVLNWNELPSELKALKLDVSKIVLSKVTGKLQLQLPLEIVLDVAPDKEPFKPEGGWRYRVAEPFLPIQLKQNVFDSISSGSVSSAGLWPRLMSSKLKKLFRLPVAQPCSSGFTSLMLAMQVMDIGKGEGDEVVMPSMTMIAVPNAVSYLGATPVFVDCNEVNYNPGWTQIEKSLTKKTKAVILTHTYGVPTPDLERISSECKSRGLWLIEDISECVGIKVLTNDGQEKLLGTFGDFACASMYANKIIHAGDGGFVLAQDPKFASRLTSIVNHGFTPKYHFVHFEIAPNAKIHGVGAAMACGCIDEIHTIMEHRKTLATTYRTILGSISEIKMMPKCGPYDTPWVFGLECENKDQRGKLRDFLAQYGIETRNYFFPLHLQPAYQKQKLLSNGDENDETVHRLPNSEKFAAVGVYLPTHSNLEMQDLIYISSIVKVFFKKNVDTECSDMILAPPQHENKIALQIQPGGFRVEVCSFNPSGELKQMQYRGHILIEAVKLGLEADECLVHERWDHREQFLQRVKICVEEANEMGLTLVEEYFTPYIEYMKSQMNFEPRTFKPWLQIDLKAKEYSSAAIIPTTTDAEILQLLVWLVKQIRPNTIWEIGCWFGHATFLMAAAGKLFDCRQRIYACDAFKWLAWMKPFIKSDLGTKNICIEEDGSLFKYFEKYTEDYRDVIETVEWPHGNQALPKILIHQKPQLVFLDISQEEEDLESIWQMIKPNLITNETIIVFNGLSFKSIQFFTRHSEEIVAIAKPNTIAKVFKYVQVSTDTEHEKDKFALLTEIHSPAKMLCRKVNFQNDPTWNHHHKSLFCNSMALLRENLHDENAKVLFISAIEVTLCDYPELVIYQPWIGIIHSVPDYPELYYTPDLRRLCTRSVYTRAMKQCKGLYTLTKFQANFLRKNLSPQLFFPIQPVTYPIQDLKALNSQPNGSLVPKLWRDGRIIDLLLVGSFARDFDLFFRIEVPENLKKVLLAGDEITKDAAKRAPSNVSILDRLDEASYEKTLRNAIVFLSLKYDGAANTIILECIARNIPIVIPNMESCIEYLGKNYPLIYEPKSENLGDTVTLEKIEEAIKYLETMDKSRFEFANFLKSIQNGAVMISLQPIPHSNGNLVSASTESSVVSFHKFDVTICICSYKRTHHLDKILKSLWENQDFTGTFQIIVWNNNESRSRTVGQICNNFIQTSTKNKSLELITSTDNYYCLIRFAIPPLMKSDSLLICDDDILPNSNFISFFMTARDKYPNDVLCVRGHTFYPHELDVENPTNVWHNYDNLKFHPDEAAERFIHFVHADACVIPRKGLQEVASIEMPEPCFSLVDDYWMSFVLNHKFNRKLRKLTTANQDGQNPLERASDSDTVGLALHTRPEVQDARIRLYIYHMLQGWPSCPKLGVNTENQNVKIDFEALKARKKEFWNHPTIGFNIASDIDAVGVKDLIKAGVKCVRIGAVGIGRKFDYELSGFLFEPDIQLKALSKTFTLLAEDNINVVLTLDKRIVSPETWRYIASNFVGWANVVGYDLINEPFTSNEKNVCWYDLATTEDEKIDETFLKKDMYTELIRAVREVDPVTPIIIEPTFWAHVDALKKFPIQELLKEDSNLIMTFHFYEPMILTQRSRNNNQFSFPGMVPVYLNIKYSETILWDSKYINEKFRSAVDWAKKNDVNIFCGEFGISRDINGADEYLKAIMAACKCQQISGFLFSLRDYDWDAMNYELGTDLINVNVKNDWDRNPLMKVILEGIQNMI